MQYIEKLQVRCGACNAVYLCIRTTCRPMSVLSHMMLHPVNVITLVMMQMQHGVMCRHILYLWTTVMLFVDLLWLRLCYMSSYRSNRLSLSHWDPYAVHRGGCLELYYCNMVEWFWWDSSVISTTNWFPSVLWHCRFGHLTCKNRSPKWPITCRVGSSASILLILPLLFILCAV